jgi:hypothetical protein
MEVDNEMDVNVDDAEEVDNEEDLQLLERLQLGIVSDDDDIDPPLEHGVESLEMCDSDDETYDPDIPDRDEYF